MLDIQTILAPVTDMLPAAWDENVRLTVAAALLGMRFLRISRHVPIVSV